MGERIMVDDNVNGWGTGWKGMAVDLSLIHI